MDNAMLRAREMPEPGEHVFVFSNRNVLNGQHLELSMEPIECRVLSVRRHPAQRILVLMPNTVTDLTKLDKTEQNAWVENGAIVRTEIGWFRTLAELNERARFLNGEEPEFPTPRPVSLIKSYVGQECAE